MILETKLCVVANLAECGGTIRAEAAIAREQIALEMERHAQALRDIEERFDIEAWRAVEKNWTVEEIQKAEHEMVF